MDEAISLDPAINPTMSVEEFGVVFGICRSTAYAGIANGSVPFVRIGGRIRIPTAAARRMLMLDEVRADQAAV